LKFFFYEHRYTVCREGKGRFNNLDERRRRRAGIDNGKRERGRKEKGNTGLRQSGQRLKHHECGRTRSPWGISWYVI
jgi:hypothetical protein